MPNPPDIIIEWAVKCANASPCAKSKRGAVIYQPTTDQSLHGIVGMGHNKPPPGFSCDGSRQCRNDCGRICVHAEQHAIRNLLEGIEIKARMGETYVLDKRSLHLVHAKTVSGTLVPGKGPSCDQCSKLILDAGLGGVWLYQDIVGDKWRFYDATEFHRVTLRNLGLHGG